MRQCWETAYKQTIKKEEYSYIKLSSVLKDSDHGIIDLQLLGPGSWVQGRNTKFFRKKN